MSIKKVTFGTPEDIKPSTYCKGFSYVGGEIKYDISAISFRESPRGCVLEFPMGESEHIYGLGLQLRQLDFRGRHARLKVNSDPVAATGDSHAPVPFFVSTAGYGIYFDSARYIEFDFGRKKKGTGSAPSGENRVMLSTAELYGENRVENSVITALIPASKGVDIYIIEGKNITEIVSQYNMLSGGGCDIPEWGLGLIYRCCASYNSEKVLESAKYFREKDIPCDIIGLEPGWQTRAYSCSYLWNPKLYPDPARTLEALKEMGYHVNLWEHAFTNPESPIYEELKEYSGNYTVWNGLVPDFSFDGAKKIFAGHHNKFVDFGIVDGYKLDECDSSDYTGGWSFPDCSLFPSGMDGEQYHALFGVLYMQTMLKALNGKPTYSEVRNAGALASCYPFALYSDLYDHGDFIRGMVTSGFSGLLWAPEVRHAADKEEFIRRLQTVVFSAHCLINGWYCEKLPWIDHGCENEVRRWICEREKLKPYLRKTFDEYKNTGKAPVRALVSDYTGDPETYGIDDEYMLGDDLIVAPIKVGEKGRKIYLPEGRWLDYFTGKEQHCGWFEVESEDIPVYKKA